jgi:cytochrome c553
MLRVSIMGLIAALAFAASAAHAGAPKPTIERALKGERCVEDTEYMRRNHMELLKHQRDRTVHEGVRSKQHSLKECIECHASKSNNSVADSKDNFCASCHSYASVKIDCFECHATKPKSGASKPTLVGSSEASRLKAMMDPGMTAQAPVPQEAAR